MLKKRNKNNFIFKHLGDNWCRFYKFYSSSPVDNTIKKVPQQTSNTVIKKVPQEDLNPPINEVPQQASNPAIKKEKVFKEAFNQLNVNNYNEKLNEIKEIFPKVLSHFITGSLSSEDFLKGMKTKKKFSDIDMLILLYAQSAILKDFLTENELKDLEVKALIHAETFFKYWELIEITNSRLQQFNRAVIPPFFVEQTFIMYKHEYTLHGLSIKKAYFDAFSRILVLTLNDLSKAIHSLNNHLNTFYPAFPR